LPAPRTIENTPSCNSLSATALRMARAMISEAPGCALCAFTTTVAPAASAEAVSPPATE